VYGIHFVTVICPVYRVCNIEASHKLQAAAVVLLYELNCLCRITHAVSCKSLVTWHL